MIVIQATFEEINFEIDRDLYVFKKAQKIHGFVQRFGIRVFEGSDLNVAKRILRAAQLYEADIIVRVLLRQFYLDLEQVGNQIQNFINKGSDLSAVPID